MKIRNGFVSNSSSSSFIIGLKDIPKSPDELKKLLLGDDFDYPVLTHYKSSFSTDLIINRIYNDLIYNFNKNNYVTDYKSENIIEEIGIMLLYYTDDYIKYVSSDNKSRFNELLILTKKINEQISYKHSERDTPTQKELRNQYDLHLKELSIIVLDGMCKKDLNYFTTIEYSDNDGEMDSYLEHGGILDPITFLYINNH